MRPGEGARTGLLFAEVLLLISAYSMTKAVRDAVFLSQFDLVALSYVMIAIAVVAGFVVSIFSRLSAGHERGRVLVVTHAAVAFSLAVMAPFLGPHRAWLSWVFYLWSAVYGLLLVAEFWLLANDLFHARQAKRLFPVLGAGAILGGVVGGLLSRLLAKPLGAPALLYVVAAQTLAAGLLGRSAWRLRPTELVPEPRRAPPHLAEGMALLARHRYVRLLALLMVCMTVAMTLVQYQYKGIAKQHFGSRQDELAGFFGLLSAALSGAGFLLQVVGTPRLLARFGVRAGLHVLPAGFVVGAVALLGSMAFPALALPAAASAVLFSDGFRFSVDKASIELLYLPIPRAVKGPAKPFIDTAVDRFAGALAGFVWIFLAAVFHIEQPGRIGWASLVVLGIVAVWLVLIHRTRREYLRAYRDLVAPEAATPPADAAAPPFWRALDGAAQLDPPGRTRALREAWRARRLAELSGAVGPAPQPLVDGLLQREADTLRLLGRGLRLDVVQLASPRAPSLLGRTLAEKVDAALERVARTLALRHPVEEVRAVYDGLRAEGQRQRAGALELLDNLYDGAARHALGRALEDVVMGTLRARAASRALLLAELAASDDRWLAAAAVATAEAVGLLDGGRGARGAPRPAAAGARLALRPLEGG